MSATGTTLATVKTDTTTRDYAVMFALPSEHRLTESRRAKTSGEGTSDETRWLEEYDAQDQLVARFRTWTKQSLRPPYRKQVGWERFSLSGELLDREVRYTRRMVEGYLH